MNDNHPENATHRRRSKISKRECSWLTALAIFALVALFAWKPLRHELMLFVALRSDGPSDTALTELADSGNRAETLEWMWRSGNLTARTFVMDYLKLQVFKAPALVSQMETTICEAARDPDLATREPALNILAARKSPDALALIRGQLSDADPAVRVMSLQALYHAADSNDVPAAVRLLDDADPRVAVQAAVLLRKVTGFDSGIRAGDALPNFVRSEDGTPPVEPNLEAIQRGVQRCRAWWSSNRLAFSESVASPNISPAALPMKDFTLENLDSQPVHLSDLRGKTVLLWFWKTGDARSFDDLAALKQLQQQEQLRLAVVGVAYDPAVGPQDDCAGEGHEHGQPMMMNGHMMVMDASPGPIKLVVRDAIAQKQISFPVLLDTKGSLVFRYHVQELPTYVLIDAQGNLRRRFAGSRELSAWTAMVEEVLPAKL